MDMVDSIKKGGFALLNLFYPIVNAARSITWRSCGGTFLFLSFDVDYQKDETVLPQLLVLLHKYDVHASFACVGMHVEKRPEVYRMLVGEGHELMNHSYSHPDNKELSPNRKWADLSPSERGGEIERSQEVFEKLLGIRPKGFRLPHFGNIKSDSGSDYYDLLTEHDFLYSSSVLDFRLRGKPWVKIEPSGIFEIGVTTCPFHPYTAMDSYHIKRSKRLLYRVIHSKIGLKETLNRSVELCVSRQIPMNVYLDPLDVVIDELEAFLIGVRERGLRCVRYTDFLSGL